VHKRGVAMQILGCEILILEQRVYKWRWGLVGKVKKKGQRGNRNDGICEVRVYNHDERRHITVQTTRHNRTEGPFFFLFIRFSSFFGWTIGKVVIKGRRGAGSK